MINKIKPFKNRKINFNKPVMVYRNLNCKKDVVDYSIKQGQYVVGHTSNIVLRDVEFKINKSGQRRARLQGIRNVHAFVKGYVDLHETFHISEFIKRLFHKDR